MGRSLDSQQRARQLSVDLICHLAVGPSFYTGRDMKTFHAGLAITETEWEISLDCTRQALGKLGAGERETNEVVALFEQYKADIVESSAPLSQQMRRSDPRAPGWAGDHPQRAR